MTEDEPDEPGGEPRVSVEDLADSDLDIEWIRTRAGAFMHALGAPPAASLSVTLVDREQIAEIKSDAFGVHAATDVLSFPMDDPFDPAPGPIVLGDIVLCPPVANAQARALGHSLEEEVEHLLVHGLLHIMGDEHADPDAERAMASREQVILAGVAR